MIVSLLAFSLAISVVPPTAGDCADPSGAVHSQVVNRTHHLITLCWNDKSSGTHSYQVNVHCQRGKETLVAVSNVFSQSVNLILECGYYCNASVRTNNLDGSHYNTPLPAFGTTDALTPIVRSTDTATNDTTSVTIIIESAEGPPLYCGAPQSVGLMWEQLEHAIVYTNWTWHNGDIVLSLHNVTFCDLPLNVSVYYTTHGSMSSSKGSGTVRPKPLDAPAIIGTVVQDSSLTVVFSDTAQCSNSSWEVCVTVDGHHQTERCSSRSAEDRSMTVDDAGKGNVYSVRARVLYGDRHSPYSETTSLGATSVLPRDQLSLSNIGLPDVRLCYAVNLPILRKATSLPKPKQFVVHYKLCGSMEERINNLSVTESCVDLQGWPGGCCYEVQLFLTLDFDGVETSLNTTTVIEGYLLSLISLAPVPVLLIVGCLLCAACSKRSRCARSSYQPKQLYIDVDIMMQKDEFQFLSPIAPDTETIYDSDSIEEEHNYRRHELDIGNEDQPDLE